MNKERLGLELLCAEVDALASSAGSFTEGITSCFERIMAAMGAERGFLLLCRENESEWKPVAGWNITLDSLFETEAVSTSIIRAVVERNIPIITTNAMNDPRFSRKQSVVTSEIRSVLCVPLSSGRGLFGVIYMDNRFSDDYFDGKDRDYLVKCTEKLSKSVAPLPGSPVQA